MDDKYNVTYWKHPELKKMIRRISPNQADILSVVGRDLTKEFDHSHTRSTYPSPERLDEELKDFKPGNLDDWELLMNEYLQVNKVKLSRMNEYRQRKFNETGRIL